jgi:hypothetical protein
MSSSQQMSPYEIVEIAIEALDWIDTAGKDSLVSQYISQVESDYADIQVNLWAALAICQEMYQRPEEQNGHYVEVAVKLERFSQVLQDGHHKSDSDLELHPLTTLPLGTLIAVLASKSMSNFIYHENINVRALSAVVSGNDVELDKLSFDPCLLVRFAVSKNNHSGSMSLQRLDSDPYLLKYNQSNHSSDGISSEFNLFPADCNCQTSDIYQEFSEHFQEKDMLVPNIPDGLVKHLRNFSELSWTTQPQPLPRDDYLLNSAEYLKGIIPDQYVISHWGHGVNSYSLNLRMAIGDLAILSQVGWGGLYADPTRDLESWNNAATWIDEIVQSIKTQSNQGFHQRKYLIVHSNFRFEKEIEFWIQAENKWELSKKEDTFEKVAKYLVIN